MATSTTPKSPKPPSQTPPTPKAAKATGKPTPPPEANGHSQPAAPPANESRIVNGTIERYEHGTLVSTTPAPKPKSKPTQTPKAPAAPIGPKPGEAYFVGRLGTEDLWELKPVSAAPGAAVIVTHYNGYEMLRQHRRSADYATCSCLRT